jgi:spore coat protein U-like protein
LSTGSSGTFAPRALRNGTDQLAYNLFRDAALTSVWGDGTGGTSVFFKTNPHPIKPVVLTIYGRIPSLQDVGAGSYADTIIVTANF